MKKKLIVYDDYNSNIPKEQGIIGSITTTIGHSALRNGLKIIEVIDNERKSMSKISKN